MWLQRKSGNQGVIFGEKIKLQFIFFHFLIYWSPAVILQFRKPCRNNERGIYQLHLPNPMPIKHGNDAHIPHGAVCDFFNLEPANPGATPGVCWDGCHHLLPCCGPTAARDDSGAGPAGHAARGKLYVGVQDLVLLDEGDPEATRPPAAAPRLAPPHT